MVILHSRWVPTVGLHLIWLLWHSGIICHDRAKALSNCKPNNVRKSGLIHINILPMEVKDVAIVLGYTATIEIKAKWLNG